MDRPPFGAPERAGSSAVDPATPAPRSVFVFHKSMPFKGHRAPVRARAALWPSCHGPPQRALALLRARSLLGNRWYRISPRPCASSVTASPSLSSRARRQRPSRRRCAAASAGRVSGTRGPTMRLAQPPLRSRSVRRYSWSFCKRSSSTSVCSVSVVRQPGRPLGRRVTLVWQSCPTNTCSRSPPPRSRASHATSRSQGAPSHCLTRPISRTRRSRTCARSLPPRPTPTTMCGTRSRRRSAHQRRVVKRCAKRARAASPRGRPAAPQKRARGRATSSCVPSLTARRARLLCLLRLPRMLDALSAHVSGPFSPSIGWLTRAMGQLTPRRQPAGRTVAAAAPLRPGTRTRARCCAKACSRRRSLTPAGAHTKAAPRASRF